MCSSFVGMRYDARRGRKTAQRRLWRHLCKTALRFQRQAKVQGCVVDFAHRPKRTAIEIDREVLSSERIRYELERKQQLEDAGWLILRFRRDLALEHIEAVMTVILAAVKLRSESN